jgi:hypothetical protein
MTPNQFYERYLDEIGAKTADERKRLLRTPKRWLSPKTPDKVLDLHESTRVPAAKVAGLKPSDLAAPLPPMEDRLEQLATDLAEAVRKQANMTRQITRLQARVRTLEARPWPPEAQATDQADEPG